MAEFIIGLLVAPAVLGLIYFGSAIRAFWAVRGDEFKTEEEFCKRMNYCLYGCGGGDGHDDAEYYGGWNCGSDHK